MSKPEVWRTWEGRTIEGKFPLRQWLGGSDHSAVFLTERPGAEKAALKLIEAHAQDADRQLARWRAAAQLSHPHLIRIFESGRCQMNGTSLLYVVTEYAEEDLSQILPQRPLTPSEVSDLLPPLLDALSYLHGKGFVHSRITPSNVLAVGDLLKLSSDQIGPDQLRPSQISPAETDSGIARRDVYDAPETAAGIVSPAGDMWSLGVTLVAALTQKVPFTEASQDDPRLPDAIPEPFRGIARECLHLDPKRRCSVADIMARLQPAGRSVPSPAPAAATTSAPVLSQRSMRRILIPIGLALMLLLGISLFHKIFPPTASNKIEQSKIAADAPAPSISKPATPRASGTPAAATQGGVVKQVLPEVPQSAKNTITGTIKVDVRVEVDATGKATTAKFKSAGHSKYFANQALKAAQGWEFSPAQVDGKPAASAWLLHFRFKRTSTQVTPERLRR